MTNPSPLQPRFGTDGLRGVANRDLTAEWAVGVGRIAARVLAAENRCDSFAIGRDTRISGAMLSASLAAGIAAEGVDVIDVGVMTTPGVAWVAAERRIPAAVISASHNPYADNGIKFFGPGGSKLSDAEQSAIEKLLDEGAVGGTADPGHNRATGEVPSVGRVTTDERARVGYENHLVSSLEGRRLDGLRVVLDCANGAASGIAPLVVGRLGADVIAIADAPDGRNINHHCGSTDLSCLIAEVRERRADLGLAFDGDADRCLAVDHRGDEIDGDRMIALFARDMAERGLLSGSGVVITVMTNLGFRQAMAARGIETIETDVGDRNVLVAMEEKGIALGGEQSGHVIFRHLATTGDGILTGLQLLDLLARRKEPLADLAEECMVRLPQKLVSVQVSDVGALDGATAVWDEVRQLQGEMAGDGRVLVRASGTEPKIRVMVEAASSQLADEGALRLARVVERSLGSSP